MNKTIIATIDNTVSQNIALAKFLTSGFFTKNAQITKAEDIPDDFWTYTDDKGKSQLEYAKEVLTGKISGPEEVM